MPSTLLVVKFVEQLPFVFQNSKNDYFRNEIHLPINLALDTGMRAISKRN